MNAKWRVKPHETSIGTVINAALVIAINLKRKEERAFIRLCAIVLSK